MNCRHDPSMSECGGIFNPFPRPCRFDVEASETSFCCGGLLWPCTTPGCTECGTHFLSLEEASYGATKPWCVPAHARFTESKAKTTCEVCRRRIGIEPLPMCQRVPPFDGCEMRFDDLFLRVCEVIRTSVPDQAPSEATASLVVVNDDCELHANQDGTVHVFRAGQLIGVGRWGRKGARGVVGVVSGIQPCAPALLEELNRVISLDGEGPIENDWDACPKCNSATIDAYGVAGGVPGLYRICSKQECPFFEAPNNSTMAGNAAPNC
jgi:hypothetical protein